MAATMLGKSVIAKRIRSTWECRRGHGPRGGDRFVEESDCVLMLGTFMTDINLGIYTAKLDPGGCISATSEQLRIRHHHYHGVPLAEFIETLASGKPRRSCHCHRTPKPADVEPTDRITISRMIDRLDEQFDDETVVIADIGNALFASTNSSSSGKTEFSARLITRRWALPCRRRWA